MVKAEYSSLQYLYKMLGQDKFQPPMLLDHSGSTSADVSVFDLSWLVSYPLPLSPMIWRRSVLQVWRLKSVGCWLLNACCYVRWNNWNPSFRLKKSRNRLCPNRSTSSIIRRKQKKGRTLKRRDDHIPRLVAWGRLRYVLPHGLIAMQQAAVLCLKTSWLQYTHLLEMCKREPEVGHGRFSCNYHWCFSLVRVSVTLPKRSENMDMWRLNRNITCSVNSFIRMRKYSIIQCTLVETLMQKSIHPKKTGLLKKTFAYGKESKYS
jgi:hypothetical protein